MQCAGLLKSDQNQANSNDPGFGRVLALGMNLTRYLLRRIQHTTSKVYSPP